jgi:UDP-glucose 4-epimerase
VIAIFCGRLIAGERPIVFGDGLQTRDYVHVDDVVAANLAAVGAHVWGAFNVGTGVETTVLQLVDALKPLADGPFEPDHQPARPGEVQRIALDCTRAREELGWESRVRLDDGLTQTLESVR